MLKKILWGLLIFFAIGVGLYPYLYLLIDMSEGFLAGKSTEILSDQIWNITFHTHIYLGGLALLIGWTQFVKSIRTKKIHVHRTIGKIYILSVLISGVAGLHIAYYADGGIASQLGFSFLAAFWLFTTTMAYVAIRKKQIAKHRRWMIMSYSLTFAAVTLRLWIPILPPLLNIEFIEAYRIISWLAWVPNLGVGFWIGRK